MSKYRPGAIAMWQDVQAMGYDLAGKALRAVEFVAEQARDSTPTGSVRPFPALTPKPSDPAWNRWAYTILGRYAGKNARDILADLDDLRRIKQDHDAAAGSEDPR